MVWARSVPHNFISIEDERSTKHVGHTKHVGQELKRICDCYAAMVTEDLRTFQLLGGDF